MSAAGTIWSSDNNEQPTEYKSLCDFLAMLNSHDAPPSPDITLQPLFNTAINPAIAPKIPSENVKVLYPFGGADSVTPFLFPNVSEVVIIDYAYFYDENTKLSTAALEDFEDTLRNKKNFQAFSGLGTFDITGKQGGTEKKLIEQNANTIYHDSERQTCYAILMRLKTQLGAKFDQLSFIDPEHKDLGFVVNFVDKDGNKRVLKYFQRSNCTEKEILTVGRAEGSSPLERTKAIQQEASTADIVLFKAASGLSESPAVLPLLKEIKSNAQIVSDKPYNATTADLLKVMAQTDENLQFISSSNDNVSHLGYFGKKEEPAAMISSAEAYEHAISTVIQKEADLQETSSKDSAIDDSSKNFNLILKHVLYNGEGHSIDSLKLNSQELEKILSNLYATLSEFGDQELEIRLKATATKLLNNKTYGQLNYKEFFNTLASDRNFRFIDILVSNPKHFEFPNEEKEKEYFAKLILRSFTSNNQVPIEELKGVFKKTIAAFSEYMHLSNADIKTIFKETYSLAAGNEETAAVKSCLQFLDEAIKIERENNIRNQWELALSSGIKNDLSENFTIKPADIIGFLTQRNNITALEFTKHIENLTNEQNEFRLDNLSTISKITSKILIAAGKNPTITSNAIVLLNSIRDGISIIHGSDYKALTIRGYIEDDIKSLRGDVSNNIDLSSTGENTKNAVTNSDLANSSTPPPPRRASWRLTNFRKSVSSSISKKIGDIRSSASTDASNTPRDPEPDNGKKKGFFR